MTASTCSASEAVARMVLDRAAFGHRKYGISVGARTDLTRRQWDQHLLEELLDAAVYIVKRMSMDEPDAEAASAIAAALVPDTPRTDMPQNGPVGRLEAGAGVADGRWCGHAAQWGVAFPNTLKGYEAMLRHIANRKETT